jgi:hypothetical protein
MSEGGLDWRAPGRRTLLPEQLLAPPSDMSLTPLLVDTTELALEMSEPLKVEEKETFRRRRFIAFKCHAETFFSRHPLDSSTGPLEVAHAQIAKVERI